MFPAMVISPAARSTRGSEVPVTRPIEDAKIDARGRRADENTRQLPSEDEYACRVGASLLTVSSAHSRAPLAFNPTASTARTQTSGDNKHCHRSDHAHVSVVKNKQG